LPSVDLALPTRNPAKNASHLAEGAQRRRNSLIVAVSAVSDDARRDAEEGRVESEQAHDGGEHEGVGIGGGGDGQLGGEGEERVGRDNAAHRVPD